MRCAHGEKTQCFPASPSDRQHPPANKSDAAKRQDAQKGVRGWGGMGGLPRERGDMSGMCEQIQTHTEEQQEMSLA